MFIQLTSSISVYQTWINANHIISFGPIPLSDGTTEEGAVYTLIDFDEPKFCEESPEEILVLLKTATSASISHIRSVK